MSMPLTLECVIITEGEEKRLPDKSNEFTLVLDGYRLFPIEEMIEIRRHKETGHIGFGEVNRLSWSDQQTTIHYRLISLQSVN